MPQLVKKRRSGWAVLAAVALVASLLAVGASPAGADTDTADNKPAGKACVGDAANDQMFIDVSDEHAFKDHINCIAYYGISLGTGDGSTFSPNDTVPRWQMALFIARAARPGGVKLPAAADQGFTDIGSLFGEARDAINQLAAAGIMAGKTATVYDPNGMVTRAEMAVILVNYLDKASDTVRIESDGTITLTSATLKTTSDDWFPDARASVPRGVDMKISAAYELGITEGTTKAPARHPSAAYQGLLTSFEPGGHVNRGEMAAFITRTLDHTNARPWGVSAQQQDGRIIVSVRDGDFQPVPRARIDMVYGKTADKDKAFGVGGNCVVPQVLQAVVGKACQIDATDPFTNTAGNVTMPQPPPDAKNLQTVWVWTGKLEAGSLLLTNTSPKPFVLDLLPSTKAKTANQAKVTDDLPADAMTIRFATEKTGDPAEYAVVNTNVDSDAGTGTDFTYLRFGTPVTVTLQLQNSSDDGPTDVSVGKKAGIPSRWQYQIVVCEERAADCDESAAGDIVSKSPMMYTTSDENGRATFSVPAVADPNTATRNPNVTTAASPAVKGESVIDARYVTVTIARADDEDETTPEDLVAPGETSGSDKAVLRYYVTDELRGNNHAKRSDPNKQLVKATITPVSKYVKLNAAGGARPSQWATVKLTDQYGAPYSDWVHLTGAAASVGETAGTIKVSGGSNWRVGCTWADDPNDNKDNTAVDYAKNREGTYYTDYLGEATIVYSSQTKTSGSGTLYLGAFIAEPNSDKCSSTKASVADDSRQLPSRFTGSGDSYQVDSNWSHPNYDSSDSSRRGEAVYFAASAGKISGNETGDPPAAEAVAIKHIDIANKTIVATSDDNANNDVLVYLTYDANDQFVTAASTFADLAGFEKALAAKVKSGTLGNIKWENYGANSVTRITLS